MAPPQNRAAWLDGRGTPLRVDNSEYPTPGADELVVRNHAVAINPVDWKIQESGRFFKVWPNIPGADIAGEVVEVGSGVKNFKPGDRVISHVYSLASNKPQDGGFQLYTAASAATTAIIPSSIAFAEGAVLPLAIDTAAHGLYDSKENGFLGFPYPSLEPKPLGKTLFLWGASSSVGALVVQLAVASGLNVIATASPRNHAFVKGLGASKVLDYSTPSIVDDAIQAIRSVGGEFAGVYDAISVPDSYKHVYAISEKLGGGVVVTTLAPPESVSAGIITKQAYAVNFKVNQPVWENYVPQALEQGKLKAAPEPLIIGKGLEYVQKGLDTNKAGVSAKKVVVEL